jgi:hypothetical protein
MKIAQMHALVHNHEQRDVPASADDFTMTLSEVEEFKETATRHVYECPVERKRITSYISPEGVRLVTSIEDLDRVQWLEIEATKEHIPLIKETRHKKSFRWKSDKRSKFI